MGKKQMVEATLIMAICIILLIASTVMASPVKTLYVGNSGNYSSIQDAINAASDGDIVYVYGGRYYESVVINKAIKLVGEEEKTVTINGNDSGAVITINAHGVEIRELTVIGGETGILLNNSNSNTISDCKIYFNNLNGIFAKSSNNNTISNCRVSGNMLGIRIERGNNNTISKCNIYSNKGVGILLLTNSSNNIISKCNITKNGRGMELTMSNNNIIYLNNFIGNGINVFDHSHNVYDNGKEGNYWDDYKGKDLNGDSIGDTSYKGIDYYPLMEPWKEGKQDNNTPGFEMLFLIVAIVIVLIIKKSKR